MTRLWSLWLCLILVAGGQAHERDPTITWAINDSPPFHIVSGEWQGQGFCDVMVNELQTLLSGYHHHVRVIPQARIARLRASGQPVCYPCMIKKSDSLTTRYSARTHSYPPHQLIATPAISELLLERYGTPIKLEDLLQDADFTFAYPRGRKFGPYMQPLIERYSYPRNDHIPITADEVTRNVLRLLHLGRVDYNIDYPVVGHYYELKDGKPLVYLPLAENQDHAIHGAIGCSNTAWGEEVVKSINQILPQLIQSQPFMDSLDFWFQRQVVSAHP